MSGPPARLCLVAGAGAGKTRRLVEHYISLLQGGEGREPLKPSQIVAITFTEKAAAEMRSRIAQELGPELADELAWAPINTIHGFAASLLRDYGLALGLDPEFAVLDADEYARLLAEAIDDLLRAGLARRDPVLGRLLGHYSLGGRGGLAQVLTWLHSSLATLGLTPEQAARATARAHEHDLARAGDHLAAMEGAVLRLHGLLAQVNTSAAYGRKIAALLAEWDGLRQELGQDPPGPQALSRLRELVKGNWYAANEIRRELVASLDQLEALTAIPGAAQVASDLLALASELEERLARECARRAALGFDELLLKARDLLRGHPGVLAQARRRWRALLVDEYQDVNPVQGELVELLAGLGQDPAPDAPPPSLLVVGDRKQSIYAFRGAEVAVLAEMMERMEAGEGAVEAIAANWRSHPALVHLFNRLFAAVFQSGELREHAPEAYVEFTERDEQKPGGEKPGDPGDAVVELLDCRGMAGEAKLNAAAWRALEARALAGYLRGLFDRGERRPGQVAVLLRKLTQVGIYEEALRRAGVEYYTVQGRGFFACQEVSDVAHALRALLDPGDGIALAAWLRSPLVGLSDESLLALAHPQPPQRAGLPQGFLGGLPLPEWCGQEQQERLARAREIMASLGGLARRLHPAELITRLLEESDLLPVLMGTGAGEQKAANLRKLIEAARRPSGVLAGGVEAFSRGLAELVADPPKDPQAPLLGEDAQVVRLMSVHQAKGLQFPVVVLPDLAGQGSSPNLLPDLGPEGQLAAAPLDPDSGGKRKPPLYQRLLERKKARAEAEKARVFYVACTRAEERLVLVLSGGGRKSSGWAEWVEEHLLDDPAVSRVDAASLGAALEAEPRAVAQTWPRGLPPGAGSRAGEARQLLARVERPPAALRLVRESVSGLENHLACPRLYVLTQRLGLDTALLPQRGGAPGGGLARAVELGSLVHRLLETTDLAAGPQGLAPALEALNPEPGLASPALALAGRLWDTELPGLLAQAPPDGIGRELPFRLRLAAKQDSPAVEVIGEMDLAAPLPEGWLVVDYKVSAKADPAPYADQMALYCLALWKGDGEGVPLPRACLAFLSPQGAELAWLEFTSSDLAAMEQRVRAAAAEIAALGPRPDPAALPPGPGCQPGKCPAARLCGLAEERP